jgi:K(+)-stimulated pyrophosphate-energized sodium pump
MTGITPAVVELSGGNLVLVIVVAVIALGALAMAVMFRQEVLAAGEGTDNMKNIAHAVQEGANAYLQRQFRTLAIFAAIAFFVLLALPADDWGSGSAAPSSSWWEPGSRRPSGTSAWGWP